MTVQELIAKLNEMPMEANVYAEGEPADKVVYEPSPFGEGGIVRIFKAWEVDFALGSGGGIIE